MYIIHFNIHMTNTYPIKPHIQFHTCSTYIYVCHIIVTIYFCYTYDATEKVIKMKYTLMSIYCKFVITVFSISHGIGFTIQKHCAHLIKASRDKNLVCFKYFYARSIFKTRISLLEVYNFARGFALKVPIYISVTDNAAHSKCFRMETVIRTLCSYEINSVFSEAYTSRHHFP